MEVVLEGKFLLDKRTIEGYIGIEDGKISKISLREIKGDHKIKVDKGKVILPGLIDVHVHLRDFEESYKESIESGTKAAVHGGITVVFDMPNTKPPIMDEKTLKLREHLFKRKSYADYALGFLLAGNKPVEADFYKIFMGASTGGIYSKNFEEDYIRALDIVSIHAEDYEIIQKYPERPPIAEIRAIERVIEAVKTHKKPAHICHISTAKGLKLLLDSRLEMLSFEVTPHHLFLTRSDYDKNPLLKVYPPLRSEEDRIALWKNIDKVPVIASDHAPHTLEDKEAGAAGLPGLETEVPLLLDAVNKGLITLQDIVEKMHINPIKIFGIENKGFEKGKDADFTIVDMKREWTIRADNLYTKAGWTPYEGWRVKGKVIMTIIRGEVVMEEDEIIGKPRGERIVKKGKHRRNLGSSEEH
ncbi:dihydroorotase [Pyrococcus furiosus DSM 3638]|uniref:Dihydroorotase n=3 Tax=Pyrococcus furiosus TaxID=2261 RepID=PYRC_PYRFU|nr:MULTISPECIES: dihydroorotase [Pyrococcus]Q8U4A0.2 RecName: Full=Dihydroorotase; Short=DHOase [Pyrococcus furiosus DSM 3638]AFN04387.1 dihydroorotase [Pyrococcus furiosus COM1]QEK77915.1 dihydroorotase [Pyrococcus furiosus DSM 3638]